MANATRTRTEGTEDTSTKQKEESGQRHGVKGSNNRNRGNMHTSPPSHIHGTKRRDTTGSNKISIGMHVSKKQRGRFWQHGSKTKENDS